LPKEEVLEGMEKSIFNGFPNYKGKAFKGRIFENGFNLKPMGTDFLAYKGSFTNNKSNKEYLELSIGFMIYDILILCFLISILLFVVVRNYNGDIYLPLLYSGAFLFSIFLTYQKSKKEKKGFFNYLKMLDNNCVIIPKTK
jgi:hypothetical protein